MPTSQNRDMGHPILWLQFRCGPPALLGVPRDLLVDRRAHKIYLYGILALVIGQSLAIYLWRGAPGWRLSSCKEILGV